MNSILGEIKNIHSDVFENIFASSPFPMLVIDSSGKILVGNKASFDEFKLEEMNIGGSIFKLPIIIKSEINSISQSLAKFRLGISQGPFRHFFQIGNKRVLGDLHLTYLKDDASKPILLSIKSTRLIYQKDTSSIKSSSKNKDSDASLNLRRALWLCKINTQKLAGDLEALREIAAKDKELNSLLLKMIDSKLPALAVSLSNINSLSSQLNDTLELKNQFHDLSAVVDHSIIAVKRSAEKYNFKIENEIPDNTIAFMDKGHLSDLITNMLFLKMGDYLDGKNISIGITDGDKDRHRVSISCCKGGFDPSEKSNKFDELYYTDMLNEDYGLNKGLWRLFGKDLVTINNVNFDYSGTDEEDTIYIDIPKRPL
ncbi:MAG: hypothetical protein Kapaf2KO_03620 [Candidatus Kapaibacteriales bacterium]